jgi:uncharacterized protein Smg (DUF494 family)
VLLLLPDHLVVVLVHIVELVVHTVELMVLHVLLPNPQKKNSFKKIPNLFFKVK